MYRVLVISTPLFLICCSKEQRWIIYSRKIFSFTTKFDPETLLVNGIINHLILKLKLGSGSELFPWLFYWQLLFGATKAVTASSKRGFSFISNCRLRGKKASNVHRGKVGLEPGTIVYQAKRFDQLQLNPLFTQTTSLRLIVRWLQHGLSEQKDTRKGHVFKTLNV